MQEQTATIYKITDTSNGKIYIGSTRQSLEKRLKQHVWAALNPKCFQSRLAFAIQAVGKELFVIESLETVSINAAAERESHWINSTHSFDRAQGYNSSRHAQGAYPDHSKGKANQSAASKKFWNTLNKQERFALLSARMAGLPKSEQAKRSLSKAKSGIPKKEGKTSSYIGVCYHPGSKTWRASAYLHRKQWGRSFRTEEEAAECYDKLSLHLHGPETPLNFPGRREEYLRLDLKSLSQPKADSSRYRYVSYNQNRSRWCVFYQGKYQGRYATEDEAAKRAAEVSGKTVEEINS